MDRLTPHFGRNKKAPVVLPLQSAIYAYACELNIVTMRETSQMVGGESLYGHRTVLDVLNQAVFDSLGGKLIVSLGYIYIKNCIFP